MTLAHLKRGLCFCALMAVVSNSTAMAGGADEQQPPAPAKRRTRITIYPVLLQSPLFGASINLPSGPGGGGDDGSEQSGSTDVSINSAWFYGATVQSDRWFAEFTALWADVSAERVTPNVVVSTDNRLVGARGGVRLVGGLSATGGFRRVSSDLTFTLTGRSRTYTGTTTPVLWDPLIGADWRGEKGRVRFDASFQGGGFGVGTDQEYSADGHLDWEFLPHVVLRGGYSFLYFKMTVLDVSVGSLQRTLVAKQTLHGPGVGIGITF